MAHLTRTIALAMSMALCFSLISAWADAPAQKPAVSFSPKVIDFGLVPSNTKCTQLVTVTFDRHVFSPDHLPILRPDRNSQAEVSLFARFDGTDSIRVVYQVTLDAYFQLGPFQDNLVLMDDTNMSVPYPAASTAESSGVLVIGESILGLRAPSQLDFGDVEVGKTKTKTLEIGFSAPPMVREDRDGMKSMATLFPHTPGLKNTAVTSSSPNLIAHDSREMGLNASIWQTWKVTFKAHLPLGRNEMELQFRTKDGYYATVPVTAEVVPPSKPTRH
jgi:hypothetical protein